MVTITVKAVTDRLIEETYTVLIRSENNILEDTVNNLDAYKENLLCIGKKVENGTTIISLEESNLVLNSI